MDPKNPTNTPEPEQPTSPLPGNENPVESEPPMPRSRKNRALENEAKKNIFLMGAGIVIILVLLGFFGITALQKLSDYTVKEKDDSQSQQKADTSFIPPPTLESPFDATSSAEISLKGEVTDGDSVKLYLNGAFSDTTEVEKDKTFTFDDVTLKEGMNSLKARVIKKGKESNFSPEIKISYISKAPTLDLSSPADGRSFSHDENPIQVAGSTNAQSSVTVNDYRAIMQPNGKFSYMLTLHDGDNDITIVATDGAGNKTEKHVKVTLH